MSVKDDRIRYVNKIIKEFKQKGYNETNEELGYRNGLLNIFGNGNLQTVTKSKQAFESFKRKVKTERHYQKDRREVVSEAQKIKQRFEENMKKREDKLIKEIENIYGEKSKSSQIIFRNRENYKIKLIDVGEDIKDKVANAFVDSVTNELILTEDEEKRGYGFKNHAEDDFVKDSLSNIKNKMKGDKFAGENMFLLQDYLFGKLIYEKYFSEDAEYNVKTRKADDLFWKDISKSLSVYYETLLKAQKDIDSMAGTKAEEIVDSILKQIK